jgi:hypothetical protein
MSPGIGEGRWSSTPPESDRHQDVAVGWSDAADEILGSDQAVAGAYVTPAGGVVLLPLTNTGLRDRETGRVTPFTSSIGMWKKLAKIQTNPQIAVAYHTRSHGFSRRPEYVLAQGRAALAPVEDRGWIERHRERWERFSGPRDVGLWEPLLRAYHWRIAVELEVERVLVWPDLSCRDEPELHGASLPEDPEPQRPPKNGTGPRIDHERAAKRVARLPHVLLGWVGGDGFPVVVPVTVEGTDERGIVLTPPYATVPQGGRRAGLLAHSFARYTFGQHQRKHTGWLEVEQGRVVYAPHTESGYHLPSSRFLYRAGAAYMTNRGLREARRAGFVSL